MNIVLILCFTFFSSSVFPAIRVESEYKLLVPEEKVSEVWDYLSKTYPSVLRPGLTSQISIEYFTDIYFDTSDYTLLKQESSLRRRIRRMPDNIHNEKNNRSLIQFKLSQGGFKQLNRGEVKFEVKEKMKSSHFATAPDLIIRNSEKSSYDLILDKLGIQKNDLRSTLVMEQKRRRLYISFHGQPFMTISLDETYSKKMWISEKFTELEIELTETLFTDSSPDKRALLEKENQDVKKVIETALPFLKLDLTPKYNKMFNLLVKDRPWYPAYVTFESWFY